VRFKILGAIKNKLHCKYLSCLAPRCSSASSLLACKMVSLVKGDFEGFFKLAQR